MKVIYQPFIRDEDIDIPLSTSNLLFTIPTTNYNNNSTYVKETDSNSEEHYVNPIIVNSTTKATSNPESKPKEKIEISKPTITHKFKSDMDIGNMQPVLDLFTNYGIPIRITSGKRNGNGPSHHNSGNAIDLTPIDYNKNGQIDELEWTTLKNQIINNPQLQTDLHNLGFHILDETNPKVLKRTKGTGPHLHIGKDTNIYKTNPEFEFNYGNYSRSAKRGMKFKKYGSGGTLTEGKDFVQNWLSHRIDELEKNSQDTSIFPRSGEKELKRILKFMESVDATVDPSKVSETSTGVYRPFSRTIQIKDPNDLRTSIHEWAHGSDPQVQVKKIEQLQKDFGGKIYNDEYTGYSDYLDNPHEIYSRLMEIRHILNLDPDKKYTHEEIRQMIDSVIEEQNLDQNIKTPEGIVKRVRTKFDKDFNVIENEAPVEKNYEVLNSEITRFFTKDARDLLDRYNPRFIEKLINDVASSNKKPNKIHV